MEDFQLNPDSNIPLWVQLKDRLVYLIMTDVYSNGDQLPTVRELSVKLNIAYNTVSKVYRDLERDGIIKTKQGKGTFVTLEKREDVERPDIRINSMIIDLVATARKSGMTDQELVMALEKELERAR